MVYLMRADLSSNFLNLQGIHRLERGGLAQVMSFQGGSTIGFALSCLTASFEIGNGKQDLPLPLSLWVSDEGSLYPPVVYEHWRALLSRLLIVQTGDPMEVWRVGLESIQTGLFTWIFLRPSRACHPNYLRKIQLSAERTKSRVLLLCSHKLPHWTLKASFEVGINENENTLFPQPAAALKGVR
jgi:hypothetical protein